MQQKIFKWFLRYGMPQKETITVKNILARFLGHLPIFEALA